MIYLDSSVAIAHLLAEDRRPKDSLWTAPLVSSRLLEYEPWTRLNARGLAASHGESARRLVERLAVVELSPKVLARALEPFPLRFGRSTPFTSRRSSSCAGSASRSCSRATTRG